MGIWEDGRVGCIRFSSISFWFSVNHFHRLKSSKARLLIHQTICKTKTTFPRSVKYIYEFLLLSIPFVLIRQCDSGLIVASLFLSFTVCLSVCLPVCLPVCLSVCLSVCLFVCLSICLFVGLCQYSAENHLSKQDESKSW